MIILYAASSTRSRGRGSLVAPYVAADVQQSPEPEEGRRRKEVSSVLQEEKSEDDTTSGGGRMKQQYKAILMEHGVIDDKTFLIL